MMSVANDVVYDVLVIGGGVVGCAILHELTRLGYKCLLVEKHSHLLTQASSGNRFIYILYNFCRIWINSNNNGACINP